jgi:LmbE family N-acetylglucosaminyl deacetylase
MANFGNEITDPNHNQRVLYFAPHPDDEVWAGGTIYKCIKNGCNVDVLLLTHGSAGYGRLNQKNRIEDTRLREMKESQKVLGFNMLNFHDYLSAIGSSPEKASCIDGSIDERNSDLEKGIIKAVRDIKPTTVLIPYDNDTHRDHRNTHEAVLNAVWRSERPSRQELGEPHRVPRVFQYEITNLMNGPTHLIDITGEPWKKVKEALTCHKSQVEKDLGYNLILSTRTLVRGLGISEPTNINKVMSERIEDSKDADKILASYVLNPNAKRAEALKATELRKFW